MSPAIDITKILNQNVSLGNNVNQSISLMLTAPAFWETGTSPLYLVEMKKILDKDEDEPPFPIPTPTWPPLPWNTPNSPYDPFSFPNSEVPIDINNDIQYWWNEYYNNYCPYKDWYSDGEINPKSIIDSLIKSSENGIEERI